MIYLRLLAMLPVYFILLACVAAIIPVGTTINNAAYNEANRKLNNPKPSRSEQALEIAIVNMSLGIEYMRQGLYEIALSKLERSILAKPDFAPTYNVLGLLYQQLGDTAAAENNFKKSISLDPSDSSTYNNYGLFLCNNGRLDEAETVLTAANNPFYESPEIALTNAGLCVYKSKPEDGERYFKQALNKNPGFAHALIQMADIFYNRSKYELAYQYFNRYQNNTRHTPKSLWLGIQICKELGYKDDVSSYALLLRNKYPETKEAELLNAQY